MSTPVFPVVAGLSYPLKESFYKPKVRTEFENGVVQSRSRWTRGKKKFALKWEKIPMQDKELLEKFFNDTGGDVFLWKHPLTGKQYKCMFTDDSFDASLVELDDYDLTLNIEEI